MIHYNLNLAFSDLILDGVKYNNTVIPEIKDGDSLCNCNLVRFNIDGEIFSDKKNIFFSECNLRNVKIQPTWLIDENTCGLGEYEFGVNNEA